MREVFPVVSLRGDDEGESALGDEGIRWIDVGSKEPASASSKAAFMDIGKAEREDRRVG